MAKSVEKKAPAKAKKAAAKSVAKKAVAVKKPTQEEISKLAAKYWEECGRPHGQDEQIWLRAEAELQKSF